MCGVTFGLLSFVSTFRFLLASSETLSVWVNSSSDQLSHHYTFLNASTSWEAAYAGCRDVGGRLVTKNTVNNDVWNQMDNNIFYWVGAIETFSPWVWTEDNTTLFEHVEDLDAADYEMTFYKPLNNNSAFACYQLCNTIRVGLQGKRCYCSVPNFGAVGTIRDDNIRCPGTYEEYCGGEHALSIYKLALPVSMIYVFDNTESHNCAYVYNDHNDHNVFFLAFDNCDTFQAHHVCEEQKSDSDQLCEGGICISYGRQTLTWEQARRMCGNKLSKLTADTLLKLKTLLSSGKEEKYWVGLLRRREWRWIDGSLDARITSNTADYDCLTWWKDGAYKRWNAPERCDSTRRAICQLYSETTDTPTTTSSTMQTSTAWAPTTAMKSVEETSSEPVLGSSESPSISITTINVSTTNSALNSQHRTNDQSSSGLSVGIGVSVSLIAIIAIISVFAALWIKRRKLLCFKDKEVFQSRTSIHHRYREHSTTISFPVDNPCYSADNNSLAPNLFHQHTLQVDQEKSHALKHHGTHDDENDALYQNLKDVHTGGDKCDDQKLEYSTDNERSEDTYDEKFDILSTMPRPRVSVSHGAVYNHLGHGPDDEIYDVIGDHTFPHTIVDYNRLYTEGNDCDTFDVTDNIVTSQCDDVNNHYGDEFDDDDIYYYVDDDDEFWENDSEFSNCDSSTQETEQEQEDLKETGQDDSGLPQSIGQICTHF